tara:strand:- start:3060 stop:3767 length:708 start_codon:yes stop_codon:yes gene_type:complete
MLNLQDTLTLTEQIKYQSWLKTIKSTPDLDGGGKILAPIFGKVLENKKFNTAFEWCAGPAWIGLWLLETGICSELVTGDINKKSVNMVRETAANHNYNVRAYTSDNLKHIPKYEKFDLVISNPPNYSNIQDLHPLGFLRYDLRPSDISWNIHKDFYNDIQHHLYKNSVMYISEVAPYDKEVYLGNKDLYDLRLETPITDFTKMTEKNNLKITDTIPYIYDESLNIDFYILKIEPQ